MRLILVRHGPAGLRSAWHGDDHDRPLTEHGGRKVRKIAQRLAKEGVEPDIILTSPLARSAMTAEILAEILGGTDEPITDRVIAPGFNHEGLVKLLDQYPEAGVVMVVAHEPDLSRLVAQLSGARVTLQKGAVVEFELDRADVDHATLVRLEQPAHLVR
jgi:phosphohistidine phosphatase